MNHTCYNNGFYKRIQKAKGMFYKRLCFNLVLGVDIGSTLYKQNENLRAAALRSYYQGSGPILSYTANIRIYILT